MAELDRRKAVAFVHPVVPKTSESILLDVPGFAAEFVFDTTRAAINLIWSGTLERRPNLRIILSHAGGTTPYLAGRIGLLGGLPQMRERAPKGAAHYLARFYYDTALSAVPNALRSLQELVGPEKILFGSDFPFAPEPIAGHDRDRQVPDRRGGARRSRRERWRSCRQWLRGRGRPHRAVRAPNRKAQQGFASRKILDAARA
jgi:hypothetical protein